MLRRPSTLALAIAFTALTLSTGLAAAQGPCGNCPQCIMLVGTNGAVADPLGNFCVSAFSPASCQPLPGSVIVVDFSGCPGISLCATQPDPLMIVNCATKSVMKIADATGTACFDIVGGSEFLPGVPCPPMHCAKIYANGILLCSPSVSTPDLDNVNGVNSSDLSIWLSMYFTGLNCPLGDYDCNGVLTGNDLSLWLSLYFASGSVVGCPSPKCP